MANPNNLFLSVSLNDRVLFVKHLAIAIKSGMTLSAGLKMIQKQTRSSSLRKIIDTLARDLENGIFLSTSLEKFRKIFGDLFINIVRVGEASGTLSENLNYLADEMKKSYSLRKKVRGAFIYPAVIMAATLGIATFMIIFIFPKILPIFKSLNVKLPFTTELLINLADFLKADGLYVGLGLVGLVIFVILIMKVRLVRLANHEMLISLPMFGKIVRAVNMSNLARTLGILLKSGVQIVDAVNITSDALLNLVYKKELRRAAEFVRTGEYLSHYLARHERLFPQIAVNMISVGENTGNLTDNLQYLAEYYEEEVDDFVRNLSSIIEPFLLLLMGVVVAFIAVSIMSPIYQITQTLTL